MKRHDKLAKVVLVVILLFGLTTASAFGAAGAKSIKIKGLRKAKVTQSLSLKVKVSPKTLLKNAKVTLDKKGKKAAKLGKFNKKTGKITLKGKKVGSGKITIKVGIKKLVKKFKVVAKAPTSAANAFKTFLATLVPPVTAKVLGDEVIITGPGKPPIVQVPNTAGTSAGLVIPAGVILDLNGGKIVVGNNDTLEIQGTIIKGNIELTGTSANYPNGWSEVILTGAGTLGDGVKLIANPVTTTTALVIDKDWTGSVDLVANTFFDGSSKKITTLAGLRGKPNKSYVWNTTLKGWKDVI